MYTLYMMIGIPGSGKTTISSFLAKQYKAVIVSSDLVRLNNPKWSEDKIFPEVYKLIQENISFKNVIFDATNIDIETRKKHLEEINKKDIKYKLVACLVECSTEICKARIEYRNTLSGELYLPLEVVDLYNDKLIYPDVNEGFDEILIFNNSCNHEDLI